MKPPGVKHIPTGHPGPWALAIWTRDMRTLVSSPNRSGGVPGTLAVPAVLVFPLRVPSSLACAGRALIAGQRPPGLIVESLSRFSDLAVPGNGLDCSTGSRLVSCPALDVVT